MNVWSAKLLQLVGMVVVLCGFLFGIQYNMIRFELGALAAGSAIFYLGWLLQKKAS